MAHSHGLDTNLFKYEYVRQAKILAFTNTIAY